MVAERHRWLSAFSTSLSDRSGWWWDGRGRGVFLFTDVGHAAWEQSLSRAAEAVITRAVVSARFSLAAFARSIPFTLAKPGPATLVVVAVKAVVAWLVGGSAGLTLSAHHWSGHAKCVLFEVIVERVTAGLLKPVRKWPEW